MLEVNGYLYRTLVSYIHRYSYIGREPLGFLTGKGEVKIDKQNQLTTLPPDILP
jgi:hypothetical protein